MCIRDRYEFPVVEMDFHIPKWVEILPDSHWLKEQMVSAVKTIISRITYIKDVISENLSLDNDNINAIQIQRKDLSNGTVSVSVVMKPTLYYLSLIHI